MKASVKFLAMAAIAASTVFTSCKKDSDGTTTGNPIKTSTAKLLNNEFTTSKDGFYSSSTETVYNLADAKTNASKIDFIHVLRNTASGGRKVVAPSSTDASDIYGDASNTSNVNTWSVRNATKFKVLSLTESDFNNIDTEANLLSKAGTGIDADVVGSIEANSVFAFKTAAGKIGIARVTAVAGANAFISGGANEGSISLVIKSQQ